MKKVTLKKLSVENYKKFEAKEFDFTGRTEVSGRNRQGKTSLMDAYFDVLTGKLADGTLPNNIRRKVDGEEVDDPVVRELVIDVDGTEYVVQKKTKKGKSSNTVEYYVNGIKRNKTEYMEILKRIADPDTIAMCSNARVFLNEIQKATAKARETLGGIAGFSESQFRAEHPEYEWIKNEGVEGDSIEEILKARRRDLRKAKSDVDDIAKQIRKEQSRQVECDETLPAQRDDLLDLLKENEKQEKVLCDASREYDRISIELAGLKRSRDALVEKAGKTARENHDRITSLLYTLKSDKKNAESKLRLAEMDLEHANKGIERHKAALAQAKKKYTEALKEKWDGDTELTAIRGEEFDPALAICPTCGQTLPEEQVETAKRKFEFNKQSRISKKLGEKQSWSQGFGYKENGNGTHQKFTDQMAKKTVVNRALKQIINTHGDVFVQEADNDTETVSKDDAFASDVAYDIEQNANTEEFIPESMAIEEQPKQPTVAEVIQAAEKEPVPAAGKEPEIPDFMKQEEI